MKNIEINNTTKNEKKISTIWICFNENKEYMYKSSKNSDFFEDIKANKIGTALIEIFNNKKFIYEQITKISENIKSSTSFNNKCLSEIKKLKNISVFFELVEVDFLEKYCLEYEDNLKNINSNDEQLKKQKDFTIRYLNRFKSNIESYEKSFRVLQGIPEKEFKKYDKTKKLYMFALHNLREKIVIPESIICYGKISRNKLTLLDTVKEFRPTKENYNVLSDIEKAVRNGKILQLQRFKVSNIQEFFNVSLYMLMLHRQQIKECQNCGKYFHTHYRSSEKYCSNVFKNGKTCSQLSYVIKLKKDDISRIFRKATINANTCKYRNKKIGMYSKNIEENHAKWKEEIKKQRQLCQEGKITSDQFEQWIRDNKYWYKKR